VDIEILPPTNDFVFKLLFGDDRHKRILIAMLKSFANLPDEDFELVFLDILYFGKSKCLQEEFSQRREDRKGRKVVVCYFIVIPSRFLLF